MFMLEKYLIQSFKVIFEEHTFGDLAYQTTWFNKECKSLQFVHVAKSTKIGYRRKMY